MADSFETLGRCKFGDRFVRVIFPDGDGYASLEYIGRDGEAYHERHAARQADDDYYVWKSVRDMMD